MRIWAGGISELRSCCCDAIPCMSRVYERFGSRRPRPIALWHCYSEPSAECLTAAGVFRVEMLRLRRSSAALHSGSAQHDMTRHASGGGRWPTPFPGPPNEFPLTDSVHPRQPGPVLGVQLSVLGALRLGWPPSPARLLLGPACAAASKRPRCRAARSAE
jgi:hypothetical protein